ncbi:hypothetical protein BpHYR1_038956 [Brachionus plicatilis]|uniref:Uncharacterized protein n=1 Tax=Brachionus plicatilis TaxID=10195 RepID=A0A3M7QB36_BRAPC|nr:hypothetical protein BpHYR1_038956 [Brachionus plicatilis]
MALLKFTLINFYGKNELIDGDLRNNNKGKKKLRGKKTSLSTSSSETYSGIVYDNIFMSDEINMVFRTSSSAFESLFASIADLMT